MHTDRGFRWSLIGANDGAERSLVRIVFPRTLIAAMAMTSSRRVFRPVVSQSMATASSAGPGLNR
jgi:hypothetical protein